MKELSLHILDIAQNSVSAGASSILLRIVKDDNAGTLTIEITDNGKGMDAEFLKTVTDPFTTTRTTRKVGLGIPLYKLAAEQTGGSFEINSEPGKGTTVIASFNTAHIDAPPMGDLASTITVLVQGSPDIDFHFHIERGSDVFECSTGEMKEILDGVPLDSPEVLAWIREYVTENSAGL